MTIRIFLILTIITFSCNSPTTKKDNYFTTVSDTTIIPNNSKAFQTVNADPIFFPETHLKDTTIISGNFVLFLRPDSLRFESYIKDPDSGIYEVDSDFGFGISTTIDSISESKKYKNINTTISDKRYIIIKDCKNSPLTIDRDTIDYGLIMTSIGKEIRINTILHSGDYLDDVDEYFNIRNSRQTQTVGH
jgi:hypothetical protein